MLLGTGERLGPYEIVAPLGSGGMGDVYRARDLRLHRDVALKVLRPAQPGDEERVRRFEREAHAVAAISHPNIIAIHDVGQDRQLHYLVSELVDGETLRARLSRGKVPVDEALEIGAEIADALAAAHDKGIVHRDLKPENVFLTSSGHVKLLDFGLAKLRAGGAEPANEDLSITAPRTVLGSVGYMSPEQVQGKEAGAPADLFALGTILYELLSGERAFPGNSAIRVLNAILSVQPPSLRALDARLPPRLVSLVEHCLQKDPDARFHSAHDLAIELRAVAPSGPVPSPAPPWAWWVIAAIGTALLLLVWIATRNAHPAAPPAFRQMTFQPGWVRGARFAPDGRSVVYAAEWRGQPLQIFATEMDGPAMQAVAPSGADLLAVSSRGELAIALRQHRRQQQFGYRGTLARVPLVGGAPREVAEDVEAAEWSHDGEQLAVVRTARGRSRLELPAGHVVAETTGWISHPRISRKDGAVAFLEHPAPRDDAGEVVLLEDGARRTLSAGWKSVQGLAFGPDGSEVWFTGSQPDGQPTALWAVSRAGEVRLLARTAGRLLLEDVAQDGRALVRQVEARLSLLVATGAAEPRDVSVFDAPFLNDLSRDGRTVIFTEAGLARMGTVYLRHVAEPAPVRLGEGLGAAISPDGRWVLVLPAASATPSPVWLLPTGAGEPRTLSTAGIAPTRARFIDDGHAIVAGQEAGHATRLYLRDLATGASRPLTGEGVGSSDFFGSQDGRSIATLDAAGRVIVVSVAGGEKAVPGLSPGDAPGGWSQGGELFVHLAASDPGVVARVDPLTGARKVLRALPSEAGAANISAVLVSTDGGTVAWNTRSIRSHLFLVEGLR